MNVLVFFVFPVALSTLLTLHINRHHICIQDRFQDETISKPKIQRFTAPAPPATATTTMITTPPW